MKVTYGDGTNKKVLKLDDVVSIKAANGEGEAIIEEIHKYAAGKNYTVPTRLTYAPKSQCWLNRNDKVVLFNVAENLEKAVEFVKDYLNGEKRAKAKTDVSAAPLAGVLSTDSGVALAADNSDPDKKEAIKIDVKK